MTRTSTLTVCVSPTRSNSRSCSTRSSFTWSCGSIVPISSRKIVPPSAASKRPILSWIAPVKLPFTWPKSSDSSSVPVSAPQLTRTNGLSLPRRVVVDRLGDHLLAGAGLAEQQHGRAAVGDLPDGGEDFVHRRASRR